MNKPFFSIITASFNSARTIRGTIQSVLDLNANDYEYIIIDGKSTDNTISIVKEFDTAFAAKGIVYKHLSEKDSGIYDAWNKGIKMSAGTWISFLGSDDVYLPDALSHYKIHIGANPTCTYISSKVALVNEQGTVLSVLGKPYVFDNLIRNMDIAQVGSFHRRDLFEKMGHFSTQYKIAGDFDFYIRGQAAIIPCFFNITTVLMGNGGVSNQVYAALKEGLEIKLKYKFKPVFFSYYDFCLSLTKCYLKKALNMK